MQTLHTCSKMKGSQATSALVAPVRPDGSGALHARKVSPKASQKLAEGPPTAKLSEDDDSSFWTHLPKNAENARKQNQNEEPQTKYVYPVTMSL